MKDETIRQLIMNCGRPAGRRIVAPHEWTPHRVELPEMPGFYFSDPSAWGLFADRMNAGHPYDVITLTTPPGAIAIAMLVELAGSRAPVYIKVQLGYANQAIGRSFHYTHY